ncbi:MAG: hypothetical protein EPO32_05985 [Anaerolineae bacterium]|nr:MAG: hypothetical protein EPO32_05985 [Anaerolineae bacterium]
MTYAIPLSTGHTEPRRPLRHAPAPSPQVLLEESLREFLPLPPFQMLLGLCEDGLPLLFDLGEADTGSLLFIADSPAALGIHLKSALASICLTNSPADLNLYVLSSRPLHYSILEREPHTRVNFHLQSPEAAILLEELANLAETRSSGETEGPVQVLAVDGLADLLSGLDTDHNALFDWLVDSGPPVGIWVLAAQPSSGLNRLGTTLAAFPTLIAGNVSDSSAIEALALPASVRGLNSGYQSLVVSSSEIIQVAIAHSERNDAAILSGETATWSPSQALLDSFPF